MNDRVFDISIADYPRLSTESSDDGRIMRAVADCEGGVLFFPKGVYEISQMLEITNCCSLLLHKSAVLKAVAEMDYVVKYDAAASYPDLEECDGHLVPSDDHDAEDWNLYITGGYIDGAGMASCLCLNSFKHFTMRDVSLRNGKRFGMKIEDTGSMWTYELVAQNLYVKCTMPGLAGNAGISSNGGDSHFIDCVVVDYTVGFVQRPLNPPAQLRQHHHTQVVVLQKDRPVAFLFFRILNPVNHGQRINFSAGSLINPLFEKHGIPVRFSASVGRNQNVLLPDLRPVCQLAHACFPLFSDLIISRYL